MLRNPKFLDQVPEEYKKVFIDGNPVAPEKLQVLKQMISKKFPVSVLYDNTIPLLIYNSFSLKK